jgi:hypothetical protein
LVKETGVTVINSPGPVGPSGPISPIGPVAPSNYFEEEVGIDRLRTSIFLVDSVISLLSKELLVDIY